MKLRQLRFDSQPSLWHSVHNDYADVAWQEAPYSNFLKGAKWSPDGVCLLTASDDGRFRIYDTPPEAFEAGPAGGAPAAAPADALRPALRVHEGELIYDYAWFPLMRALDPASCCFAASSRAHPVHLWDACSGELRCSYRSYDAADEPSAAYSLAFDPAGGRLLAGHLRAIHVFDISRPGRDYRVVTTHAKGQDGQPGIISCMAFAPPGSGTSLLAAGAYSGVAALYDSRTLEALCVLEGHSGGITHLAFSADGNYLYTGARRDGKLLCWDVRHQSGVVYAIDRAAGATNQRLYFDIEPSGRHLATGGEDGVVRFFDLRDGSPAGTLRAAEDVVSGCAFHPVLPLLATASGHRRLVLEPEDGDASGADSSEDEAAQAQQQAEAGRPGESSGPGGEGEERGDSPHPRWRLAPGENSLRLWWLASQEVEVEEAQPDQPMEEAGAGAVAAGSGGGG